METNAHWLQRTRQRFPWKLPSGMETEYALNCLGSKVFLGNFLVEWKLLSMNTDTIRKLTLETS